MSEHLTNVVVVALIHDQQGRIFMARRAATKTTFPDQFELVGGHIDPGEQPVEALKREIKEEIGVDIIIKRIVDAFTYESEGMFKVEICYLCTLANPAVQPVLNPADHSEAKWITADEISLIEKEDEETEVLRKAFKILEGAAV